MTKFAKIISSGSYLPKRVLTNKELEDIVDTSDDWITERTGIKERRVSSKDETSLDMAYLASIDALSKSSINKDYPIINSKENKDESTSLEKRRIELKFSCGDDGITEYINDGWIILKEDSQEKICTWKSVPASKNCDMEKDKGCKITKPDKIGKEIIYLLEK